jgi:hypothetical protein
MDEKLGELRRRLDQKTTERFEIEQIILASRGSRVMTSRATRLRMPNDSRHSGLIGYSA